MADDTKPEDQSDLPSLALPANGFQSRIPPYLLDNKTEDEIFLLTEVSKMSAFIEWAAPILISSNHEARKTNGRLKMLEAWRSMFVSWYGFAGAILSVIGGIAGLIMAIKTIASVFSS